MAAEPSVDPVPAAHLAVQGETNPSNNGDIAARVVEYTRVLARVRACEAEDISRRRCVHESKQPEHTLAAPDDLVGLALSGGGVRSASFNLGLLQSFLRSGLLKHIDYLATVSGGGYIGSYLASLVQKPNVKLSENDAILREQLRAQSGQPERVVRFARHGKYLNRPRSFLNFYLMGLFLNNLSIFSGLACLCMAIAFVWRLLDTNSIGGFLYLYLPPTPHWTELWRPFLPSLVFFFLWLLAWVTAFARAYLQHKRPETRLSSWLLLLAVASLLIGIAVVLATPVISIPQVGSDDGQQEGVVEVSGRQNVMASSIIGLIVTALMPFLRPERLLRSGIHPKSIWERRIFLIATSALLVGVPFILIWLFAHHDFAGRDYANRDRQLLMSDINFRKWESFWERVGRESAKREGSGAILLEKLRDPEIKDWLQDKNLRKKLASLPVPLFREDREKKQKIIDAINSRVIGVEKDAIRDEVIGDGRESDFADRVVNRYWREEWTAESSRIDWQAFLTAKIHHHSEWPRLQTLLDRLEHAQLVHEETKELNRLMLEVCYPEEILPRRKVYRSNVIEQDQRHRLYWLLGLGGIFIVSGCISLNATSLHSFYRDRLAETFLEPIEDQDRTISLSELDTTANGAPYFLFAATLNRKPQDRNPSMLSSRPAAKTPDEPPHSTQLEVPGTTQLGHERPGETPTETFLLSRHFCGSASLGYRATSQYQKGRLNLDDAMAISGAAFSPVQTSNPLIGFLMTIFNMRLGQWLLDPSLDAQKQRSLRLRWPSVHALLAQSLWFGNQPLWYFVTDGGHHENLGLWPLLQRRCRLIIVSDASEDSSAGFADLLRVLRRARFEQGIRISGLARRGQFLDEEEDDEITSLLRLLRPDHEADTGESNTRREITNADTPLPRLSRRHFFCARIVYPPDGENEANDPQEGYLIYLKPTLTGDEPVELQGYAALNADFPHNPTMDQLYDEDRFESYRQLGEHIGDHLADELTNREGDHRQMWRWEIGSPKLLAYFSWEDTPQQRALNRLRDDRRGALSRQEADEEESTAAQLPKSR
jgi:hypothetical protein